MFTKKLGAIVGGICLIGSGFTAGLVIADDASPGAAAEAMEAMLQAGTPGPEHAHMAKFAGKWNMAGKMWMDPSAPPQETTGKVTWEMIMDGRFMLEKVDGQPMFPGAPNFKGMNICGFDNVTKRYFFTWIDNATTGVMVGWGTSPDGGKTIEYFSECPDCMTGKMTKNKSIVRHVSLDEVQFEMFSQGPDGEWMKNFESTYTRVK
jgi:hypothetical protein